MIPLVLDTSVAVPLLVQSHAAHKDVNRWWNHQVVALSGHALVETYSVLTRLPGDLRLEPGDAARLIRVRFVEPLMPKPETIFGFPGLMGELGIAGGAAYDALVALAAVDNGAHLATRDLRARSTYEAVGARVLVAT